MNYLAHAHLSFGHPEILVGNMISDFVKGKKKFDFSTGIQKGIQLHRAIDTFTDFHPVTKEAAQFLKPAAGAYAGAFIDVVYDHFLANDQKEFNSGELQLAATSTYNVLQQFEETLPFNFRQMLPYMKSQNWLYYYHTIPGIEKSFGGLVRRALYIDSSIPVFFLFEKHYASLEKCYKNFFPDVKGYAEGYLRTLLNT